MSHFIRVVLLILIVIGGFWLWREAVKVDEASPVGRARPRVDQVDEVEEGQGREVAPDEFVSEAGVVLRVTSPLQNSVIISPLMIAGEAPGTWYFEASFPVVLVDWDGLIIAEGIATAQDDWMTESFVPFTATLTFTKPSLGENGALILRRDDPSGSPENDDAVEIPVRFE